MPGVVHPDRFPDTRWSLILRLRAHGDDLSTTRALNELCQAYWQPLYVYLRRTGLSPESAQDAVQGFLARLLANDSFQGLEPGKGRFRSFLLTTLRRFVISEARREGALKRGGANEVLSLEVEQAEEVYLLQASDHLSPEAAFDRQWAQTVWTRALDRLRDEHAQRGKEHVFDRIKPYLTEEIGNNCAGLAAELGLAPNAMAVALHRLRRRLREVVMDELAETVEADADLQAELHYFLSVWSK